ncbi:MAG: hypothetical protein LUD52_00035 [Opitutae bacterium]|nr:hypothetical protein [Opitutae bacterium]
MKLEENGVQEKFAIRAATTVAIESATTDKIFLDLIAATVLGLVVA